ncbi:16S rRNA (adenine(1518)-N(6)/adenine(1519)-N(6))-dimethyltransferase RsmA [Thalassospira alkalitolerans]|uniref:Ribosomal RNA small subunit methyltransferase A n=1 Tax=Thalassospira alkalitolerans TaxID=1293890 RepID=A0A1Y2L7Z5_9PROT|nr:16S rRNA (adenine(1518)-N(6)/adenine(1519)-N(6))-dimethyltransferase RsmA [Thalassospira alkalitolerans]OSQ44898.1 16S rRNA methyltransferase [Thalassospira alkalitolerans]
MSDHNTNSNNLANDGLPPLRDVIATHELSARKKFGQNFLFDLNLTGRIARAAAPLEDATVIEIGPGPGGLTRALLFNGAKNLTVIERDPRCQPVLEQISNHYPGALHVIDGDALEVDVISLGPAPRKVVANLPYNIGTQLLLGWLMQIDQFTSLTLMFQKEVAERVVASPKSKAYGRLSVLCQYLCDCQILFDVHRSAFTPPPKVTSAVVQLRPKADRGPEINLKSLGKVTQAAFGQRRKMLRASLKTLNIDVGLLLERAAIVETVRAEELSIADFVRLTQVYDEMTA